MLWTLAYGGAELLALFLKQPQTERSLARCGVPFLIAALFVQTTSGSPGLLRLPRRGSLRGPLIAGAIAVVGVAAFTRVVPSAHAVVLQHWASPSEILRYLLLVPLSEELLFRGMLFTVTARAIGPRTSTLSRTFPVVTSAVCFGLGHWQYHHFVFAQAWPQMVWATGFGLVLGYQRLRTGSLLPGLATHIGINLVAALVFLP